MNLFLATDSVADNWRDITEWSGNALISSADDLAHYLTATGTEYLLVTRDYAAREEIRYCLRPLIEQGLLQECAEQSGSYLLQFTPEGAAPDAALLTAFAD